MRSPRTATAATAVALAFLASACGGDDDGGGTVIETDAETGGELGDGSD